MLVRLAFKVKSMAIAGDQNDRRCWLRCKRCYDDVISLTRVQDGGCALVSVVFLLLICQRVRLSGCVAAAYFDATALQRLEILA